MRSTRSAGVLLYRHRDGVLEVLLVHPGGPYWTHKDDGAWSIPKGEHAADEDALAAAQREFLEETGFPVSGPFRALTPVKQRSGKIITAWAAAGDLDAARIHSNSFALEWPPGSGTMHEFPEVARAEWFTIAQAGIKLSAGQLPLLAQLVELL